MKGTGLGASHGFNVENETRGTERSARWERTRRRGLIFLVLGPLIGGCASGVYERWADRVVFDLIEERTDQTLGLRAETVLYPEDNPTAPNRGASPPPIGDDPDEAPPGGGAAASSSTIASDDEGPGLASSAGDDRDGPTPNSVASAVLPADPKLLSLTDCLRIATRTSRQYLDQKDGLFLTALALTGTRFSFTPQLDALVGFQQSDSTGARNTTNLNGTASVSQILPYGGSVSISGTTTSLLDELLFSDPNDFSGSRVSQTSSSLSVTLRQPLLRGAGYEPSHEALTQAERSLIYAIRDFELFREDFSISVATNYYNLVQQKQSITNTRNNFESFIFLRRQAEALFQVGRQPELDVIRARRNELQAQNQLLAAIESYQDALDRFKIFLGLSIEEAVDVIDESPEFVSTNYALASAVDVALSNRLDFFNRREQLQDSARAVRIAKNNLLPDLDIDLNYNLASDPDQRYFRQDFDNRSYTVGVTLGLPVNRVQERNQYRSSQISYNRASRDFDLFRENLILGIRNALRELDRRRQSLEIQSELIVSEEKNKKVADIRFQQGEIPNRDVVEAQQSLLDAQNGYIGELVNYEIARLQLLRDLGILFIDENGMFKE